MRIFAIVVSIVTGISLAVIVRSRAMRPATHPPDQVQAGPKQWDLPEQGFSLRTPGDWVRRDASQPQVVLILRHETPRPGQLSPDLLMVTVVPLPRYDLAPSLDTKVEAVKNVALKNHPETKFDPTKDAILDGWPAKAMSFTETVGGKERKELRLLSAHDRRM